MNAAAPHDKRPDPDELRRLAESAARAAGLAARAAFRTPLNVTAKPDGSEVTSADYAAQQAAVDVLRAARPGDLLLTEEARPSNPADHAPRTGVWWVIDPIDGTRNFVRGIPIFCCSVGALVAGAPSAGAVFDPIREDLYSAGAGGPLLLNGDVPVMPPRPRRPPLVAVPSKLRRNAAAALPDDAVIRSLGSTALHLALVAAGQIEIAVSTDSKLWDLAAGAALVQAAGGRISAPDGSPLFPLDPAAYDGRDLPARAWSAAYCHSIVAGGLLDMS